MAKEKDPPLSSANKRLIEEANGLYDHINKSWLAVESDIQTSGLLKPVVIRIGQDEDGDSHYIGIQKFSGIWRISAGSIPSEASNDADVTNWTPIGFRPIQDRVYYFSHIPKLYAEVVKSNQEVVADLRVAVGAVDDTLRSLGLK